MKQKELIMIIVNDIQDAIVMKKKLMSILRRSDIFDHKRVDILCEIAQVVDDLAKNIDRIEMDMIVEALSDHDQAA